MMRSTTLLPLARLVMAFACIAGFLHLAPAAGQTAPGPRPVERSSFHDAAGLFNDEQLATLRRDAQLLQSSNIPILVYVREATPADASLETSQQFADDIRQSWGIESSEAADDGLVLLFTWVPENPGASTAVFSYGPATFEGSGLTPASIQETIDTSVRSLIEQQKPFEAVLYYIRETRYDGIYAPPPPPPIEGMALTAHDAIQWMGPALTAVTVLAFAWLSARFRRQTPSQRKLGVITAIVIAGSAALWALSVYAQSRTGVVSALLAVVALAIATFMWSRAGFLARSHPFVRHLSVPSTNRLMRKRRQARALLARGKGARR
jgi:uncharacterized membrane protein YgcG